MATDGIIRGDVVGGVGTLTVANDVSLANNAILRAEVSRTGTDAADPSQIAITGAGVLNLAPTAGNKFSIDIQNNLANPLVAGETYTITLATVASGTINLNGAPVTGVIDPSNYTLWPGMTSANNVSLVSSGGNLTLTFSPVPEPTTVLGLAAGSLGLGGFIRRRLRLGDREVGSSNNSIEQGKLRPCPGLSSFPAEWADRTNWTSCSGTVRPRDPETGDGPKAISRGRKPS